MTACAEDDSLASLPPSPCARASRPGRARRLMRLVAASPGESRRADCRGGRMEVRLSSILLLEALEARPCLDQRAVHAEVLAAHEAPLPWPAWPRRERTRRPRRSLQPVAVLGEHRRVDLRWPIGRGGTVQRSGDSENRACRAACLSLSVQRYYEIVDVPSEQRAGTKSERGNVDRARRALRRPGVGPRGYKPSYVQNGGVKKSQPPGQPAGDST